MKQNSNLMGDTEKLPNNATLHQVTQQMVPGSSLKQKQEEEQ